MLNWLKVPTKETDPGFEEKKSATRKAEEAGEKKIQLNGKRPDDIATEFSGDYTRKSAKDGQLISIYVDCDAVANADEYEGAIWVGGAGDSKMLCMIGHPTNLQRKNNILFGMGRTADSNLPFQISATKRKNGDLEIKCKPAQEFDGVWVK